MPIPANAVSGIASVGAARYLPRLARARASATNMGAWTRPYARTSPWPPRVHADQSGICSGPLRHSDRQWLDSPQATFRGVPDLADVTPVILDPALDHDIDQQVQQGPDVSARQSAPTVALLDQQHELLKSELRARSVHTRYRPGVTGVDVAQIVEGFCGAQFRQKDAIGAHAQARLQQFSGTDSCQALLIFAVVEAHVVGVIIEYQLVRIFDGDQAFVGWNLAYQRLVPGGFPGSR